VEVYLHPTVCFRGAVLNEAQGQFCVLTLRWFGEGVRIVGAVALPFSLLSYLLSFRRLKITAMRFLSILH
jgi:hypothetical protein